MAVSKPQHILVSNPHLGGHYIEYVQHMLKWLQQKPHQQHRLRLSILLPQESKVDLEPFLELPVRFHWLEEPLERFENVPAKTQARLISEICQTDAIDTVFFPHMEKVRPVLDVLKLDNVKFSGIVFSTFNQFGFPNDGILKKVTKTARRLAGGIARTYQLLRGKRWKHVFLLNDPDAEKWYSRIPFVEVEGFSFIVDPLENAKQSNEQFAWDHFGIQDNKPVVLCIGDLREQKNAHTLLEAFLLLANQGNQKLQLLIIGDGDKQYLKHLSAMVREYSLENVSLQNRFATDGEFRWLIANANVVAIPYLNFFRSSGLLNHALRARKPVLCGNMGLIYRAVSECKSGIGVDPADASAIASAVVELTDGFEVSNSLVERYLNVFDPDPIQFADAIFEKLANVPVSAND